MIFSGKDMLVKTCFCLLLLESVYTAPACHPDAPETTSVQYVSMNGSIISMARASCYHDVAFYYNDAYLARPKHQHAWLEPWVRQAGGYMLKHFGGCAVPRINTGMSGTRCENFGAPKPLVLFLFLTPANFRTWSNTRYHEMDGGKRNSIKFESIFFNDDQIKDVLGHEMGGISELMTHGTFHEYVGTLDLWSKGGGFSQFPIYDFFHQSRDFSSRDRWYSKRGSNLWFLFFHGLWLETGQNIHFLTKFWNNYSLHYPKSYNSTTQVWTQAGNINIGEVIHFMSAAVGRNLTATASSRFTTNWKPETYFAAVAEYPALTYVS